MGVVRLEQRPAAARLAVRRPPPLRDPLADLDHHRRGGGGHRHLRAPGHPGRHGQQRHPVRLRAGVAGVIVLRRTQPDLPRAFRTPAVPLVPILAVIACVFLMLNLGSLTWWRFLVWMAIGFIVYFGYSYRHSRLAGEQRPAARR